MVFSAQGHMKKFNHFSTLPSPSLVMNLSLTFAMEEKKSDLDHNACFNVKLSYT